MHDSDPIRRRSFTISLSDSDMARFIRCAYGANTTPEELLQGFICDMFGGAFSNGGPSRALAAEYLTIRGHSMRKRWTLLFFILNSPRAEKIRSLAEKYEAAQVAGKWLEYYTAHPEEADEKEIKALKKTQRGAAEIGRIYKNYSSWIKKWLLPPQDLNEGMEEIAAYLRRLDAIAADAITDIPIDEPIGSTDTAGASGRGSSSQEKGAREWNTSA